MGNRRGLCDIVTAVMDSHVIEACLPSTQAADRVMRGDSLRSQSAAADSQPGRAGFTKMAANAFRSAPTTPHQKSRPRPRGGVTFDRAGLDEEGIRTRRYWQRWGEKAAQELLQQPDEQDHEYNMSAAQRQSVYSGRVGRSPSRVGGTRHQSSTESIDTDISLLTCSSVGPSLSKRRRQAKKIKEKKPQPPPVVEEKPDWVKLAKERRGGMLDRMLQKDVSAMQGTGRSHAPNVGSIAQRDSGIFNSADLALLQRCRQTREIKLLDKSYSTENVLSHNPKLEHRPGTVESRTSGRPNTSSTGGIQDKPQRLVVTGRTLSPRQVASVSAQRPSSANPGETRKQHGVHTVAATSRTAERIPGSPFCVERPITSSATTAARGIKLRSQSGPIDIKGKFSQKVKQRIQHTITALERVTGHGDPTDVIAKIDDDYGRYTASDYARLPRYPQNIRIAPQLSRVIKEDIRLRMGRPRRHEIRVSDLKSLDAERPALDRTHRNLLIFNWLITLEEPLFDCTNAPDIVDQEGEGHRERTYPEIYTDIVDGFTRPSTVMRSDADWDSLDDDVTISWHH